MHFGRATKLAVACAALQLLVVRPLCGQVDQASMAPGDQHPTAEIHGARITIITTENSADCPGQDAILERVRRHFAAGSIQPEGPLEVVATIDGEGAAFVADIVVSGRHEGRRTLRAAGPGCDELVEALAVSLALILDGTMAQSLEPLEPAHPAESPEPAPEPPLAPVEPPGATAAPPPPRPPPPPPPPAASPRNPRPVPRGWMATGAALTSGVPHQLSGAGTLSLAVEYGRLSVSLGAFLAPTQSIKHHSGYVDVRLLGGTLRGCGRFVGPSVGLRADACAVAGLGELHGSGRGYRTPGDASRPWRALGGALALRGPIVGPLGWGLDTTVLAPLAKEEFFVTGVDGVPFSTGPVAFFGGAQLWVRFR